ncbi:protein LYRIC isoform X2 [Hemibagrus wyckioides]|uniref:protein LYRIC isoform X2 n=1 Tax=Hemibagrus wyckioides TaxID=337641 RepID=UPI00266C84C9|nr:protein LYRIC isoform X2 [Hemibagrus wyckioides]
MALEWREAVERMDVYLRELLSSGLLLLHAELGVDLGLKAELLPPGLLTCVAAGLGLLLALLLCFSVCRCFSKKATEKVAPEAGKTSKPKSEEVKKRSRKRGGDKKVQRNGLAVDLEEDLKLAEAQNQSESPDLAGGKSDKGKKNKKKAKAAVKDTTSTSERREPEEGNWETKVSQREKRQQRRKDKGAGDESGSPGGTEFSANSANAENTPAVEEPKIISTPSVTTTSNNTTKTTSNTKTKTSNIITTTSNTTKTFNTTITTTSSTTKTSNSNTTNTKASNTNTTNTKTSAKNTKTTTTTTTPAPKAQKNGQRSQQVVAPVEHEPSVAEVTRAVIPPVSHAWDVMGVNGSGSWDLGMSVPPHTQTWNSVKSEASVWPQDMEGSWMIVDGSHIPVSLHGITAGVGVGVGVEAQVVPEQSWVCPAPVDDEWSGPNSGSADPASDYCAPCEEWGNYEEPAGGAVSHEEPQDSDPEKDKDEPAAAPGSGKAKKKKKKKKKGEEAGSAAQVEVGVAKDQNTAGNMVPKNTKEQELMAPPRVLLKPAEPEAPPKSTAPPPQKKPEESWESQKQVKKKKARRET